MIAFFIFIVILAVDNIIDKDKANKRRTRLGIDSALKSFEEMNQEEILEVVKAGVEQLQVRKKEDGGRRRDIEMGGDPEKVMEYSSEEEGLLEL